MSNQNTATVEFEKNEFDNVKNILLANGWVEEMDSNPYASFRLKSPKGSVSIMYSSGKLVFQGREDFTSLISNLKDEEISVESDFKPHIGVDEVGKGDYFGPMVVVSCFVTQEFAKKVKLLGFADSKKFTDGKIENLFNMVSDYPYYYSSIVHPMDYNRMIKEYKNASLLLAKQHSLVIEKGLKDIESKGIKCEYVVIDQFSSLKSRVVDQLGEYGKRYELRQFHKGESDIAVAVASVIARAIFLKEWDIMCERYGMEFPKGSVHVIQSARKFLAIHGQEKLSEVAKVGFKTTKEVLKMF